MKKILALCLALCLFLPASGLAAAQSDSPIISARVIARTETALKAPASGELAPFSLREGDFVRAGAALVTVEPKSVYADIDGTVAAVYAQAGDVADAAVERFGSVLAIERVDRYEIKATNRTGYNSVANRNLYVGSTVYLRSANEKHFAEGLITQVSGRNFTVAVLGGDLVFTEDVKVYRLPDYDNKSLLARAELSAVEPYAVTAAGTVIAMNVRPGDAVKAGDLLFTYVPDTIDPALRGKPDATTLKADQDLIITAVSVQPGASVQKGQALFTTCPYGQYQLCGEVEEADLARVQVGISMTVTFEELNLSGLTATVSAISPLGSDEDPARYKVYLDFDAPDGVMIGMHATAEI